MLEPMHVPLLLGVIVITALIFDFINGFHDTANAIATVVATRVLSPMAAIIMSAVLNFAGALALSKVATTIAKGILVGHAATHIVIFAAVIGAIVWNLITWWKGIPSSSSHALIGGLIGAGFAAGGSSVVKWHGIVDKVIVPMVSSPIIGGVIAFGLMTAIFFVLNKAASRTVAQFFRPMQMLSAAAMSYSHGSGDAQKSMGIITLALVSFHKLPNADHVPVWVKLACAIAMALGTATGGYRIMRTMGQRITRLEPVHGFVAETAASAVILFASVRGLPVSTTHVISGSIFGVGLAKRTTDLRWTTAQRMVAAWVLTLPAAAACSGIAEIGFRAMHLR